MNINRMRTSASLKLILGLVIATCVVVAPSHAQSRVSDFNGTFVLTNDLQWGKALLHAGTYSLVVHSYSRVTESLYVYNVSTGKMVLTREAAINPDVTAASSEIVIATRGDQRAVESLQIAGMGVVFRQTHPFATSESAPEEARNVQAIPVETAKK
jgi:hypothetical protein